MNRIVLCAFLFFSVCAFGQSKKEKKAIKTYGVKSVTENVTETVNGKVVNRKDSYSVYDKNANVTSNEEYRKDGTLKHKETTKYDAKGNKLEETVWDAAEVTPNPEKYSKQVSKFDSEDSKLEQSEFDAAGKLLSKTKYSYNGDGDKVQEEVFDPAGKLIRKYKYSYNSKGLKIDRLEYDAANVLISSRRYQYEF